MSISSDKMETFIQACLLCLCALLINVNGDCLPSQRCVLFNQCPELLALVQQNPLPKQVVERLQRLQCGYDRRANHPKVCCDQKVESLPTPDSSLFPSTDVCGQDPNKRIVGGQLTELRQFPWLVLLEYQKPDGRGFQCGGSLINEKYIVTAAHCVINIPRSWQLISVRLGEHDLDNDPDCEDADRPGFEDCAASPIDIPVGEIITHPNYKAREVSKPNDIALIRLSRPVTYSKSISPICLPTKSQFLNNRYDGVNMMVAGWGRTENSSQSKIKLKLEVPVNSEQECSTLYKKHGAILNDGQICAGGQKGKDSCSGDSGGPLMYLERTPPEYNWYLYGIVSFGPIQCGTKDFPGIYTLVPKYMKWITDNLKP